MTLKAFLIVCATIATLALGGCAVDSVPQEAQLADISTPPPKGFPGKNPEPARRSNTDMIRDFLDLNFALENGERLERFTRIEGPITLRVSGTAPTYFQRDLDALLTRLRHEAGIHITTTTAETATITVNLVPQKDINKLQPRAACFVVPNVSEWSELNHMWRPAKTNWKLVQTRTKLAIVIPQDEAPQEIRDCLHEELAQSLGPLNDLYRLPDSIFNDDNVHTVLTGFDMLMLRVTYDSKLYSGMSRDEVAARLPAIFSRLNPQGEEIPAANTPATTRTWRYAIEKALGPGSDGARGRGARAALREAQAQGWRDHRLAFSYYLAARAELRQNQLTARNMLAQADAIYASSPLYRLPRVRTLGQLAALDIESGESDQALPRLDTAIQIAKTYQSATLLTDLLVLKSEALLEQGKSQEAANLRLNTLGWASYGYGKAWASHANVQIVLTGSQQQTGE